jgi:hypothetical protein
MAGVAVGMGFHSIGALQSARGDGIRSCPLRMREHQMPGNTGGQLIDMIYFILVSRAGLEPKMGIDST